MTSVPFELSGDWITAEGLARLDGRNLVLEFGAKFLGLFNLGMKSVSVAADRLQSVEYRRGWFGTSVVVLQATELRTLYDLPGNRLGRVSLTIPRRDREAAERFVAAVRALLPAPPDAEPEPEPVFRVGSEPRPLRRTLSSVGPMLWAVPLVVGLAVVGDWTLYGLLSEPAPPAEVAPPDRPGEGVIRPVSEPASGVSRPDRTETEPVEAPQP